MPGLYTQMFILVREMVFPSYPLILECTSALYSSFASPQTLPTFYRSGTQLCARDSEGESGSQRCGRVFTPLSVCWVYSVVLESLENCRSAPLE